MSIRMGIIGSALLATAILTFFYFQNTGKSQPPRAQFLQSKFSARSIDNRVIQLKLNADEARSNSEKVEISAEFKLPFDFTNNLHFRWKLGEDVMLVDGVLSGQVNGLIGNESKKLTITVTGFSKETNHQIGFEISGIKNGKNIFADGLIASDLENTFENIVQNVEKIKADK